MIAKKKVVKWLLTTSLLSSEVKANILDEFNHLVKDDIKQQGKEKVFTVDFTEGKKKGLSSDLTLLEVANIVSNNEFNKLEVAYKVKESLKVVNFDGLKDSKNNLKLLGLFIKGELYSPDEKVLKELKTRSRLVKLNNKKGA